MQTVTELLVNWGTGDEKSREMLMPIVYQELRQLARSHMRKERSGHTLQTTGLIHEAYLRLVDQKTAWKNRNQFFAIASSAMRRVLVDSARRKQSSKRGAGAVFVPLDDFIGPTARADHNLVLIDEALNELERIDPRSSKIVELRFFSGFTTEEIAATLNISAATVQRHWVSAKAWLYQAVCNSPS